MLGGASVDELVQEHFTKTQLDWDVGILEARPNPWALYVVILKLFLRIFHDEMGVLCFVCNSA